MPKIKVLDDTTINKIAAGEVIERPASVVKELVENSLDANATDIQIKILGAGKKLIQVVDNGCGMSEVDAVLAFERHATSKISSIEDLDSIETMGFRGEALSSIASVAEVILSTRDDKSDVGVVLKAKGGKVVNRSETGMAPGTSIEVKNLFANVPARLKYLKSDRVELSHIINIITERALANPNVSFRLLHDDVEVLNLPGSIDLLDRFLDVFGRRAAKVAVRVESGEKGVQVKGMLAKPSVSKPTFNDLHIFVNSRPVSNKKLKDSVEDGYSGMLMKNRHPIGVMFLDVDPGTLDVNVHPTKREVRFSDLTRMMKCVRLAVADALGNVEHITEVTPKHTRTLIPSPKDITTKQKVSKRTVTPTSPLSKSLMTQSTIAEEAGEITISEDEMLPMMKPIGQVMKTYIIAQSGKDLVIIDQHAAHERVMLEKLKASETKNKTEQRLITPIPLELSKREIELVEHYRSIFEDTGFKIEPFGKSTYLVRAVPVFGGRFENAENLMEMINELTELGKAKSLETRRDDIRHLIACHSAIRAGESLSQREMAKLIHDMHGIDNPYTCAHGRPTIIKITEKELEKMFKRVV